MGNNKRNEMSILYPVRGLLAVGIFFFHLRDKPFGFGSTFVSNLYYCVDIFFIISGVVIAQNYLCYLSGRESVIQFIIKRTGRIYPVHFFMLIVWVPYIIFKSCIHHYFGIGANPIDTSNPFSFISNLFLIHSLNIHEYLSWNVPSWSISVEFYTYLFFALTLVLRIGKSIVTCLCIIFLSYSLLYYTDKPDFSITSDYGLLRCIGGFYAGVLIYHLKSQYLHQSVMYGLLSIILFILVLITLTYHHDHYIYSMALIVLSWGFILCLTLQPKIKIPFWGSYLGVLSYAIYMSHFIFVEISSQLYKYILGDEHASIIIKIGVCSMLFALVLLVSHLIYKYIEYPCRKKIYSFALR